MTAATTPGSNNFLQIVNQRTGLVVGGADEYNEANAIVHRLAQTSGGNYQIRENPRAFESMMAALDQSVASVLAAANPRTTAFTGTIQDIDVDNGWESDGSNTNHQLAANSAQTNQQVASQITANTSESKSTNPSPMAASVPIDPNAPASEQRIENLYLNHGLSFDNAKAMEFLEKHGVPKAHSFINATVPLNSTNISAAQPTNHDMDALESAMELYANRQFDRIRDESHANGNHQRRYSVGMLENFRAVTNGYGVTFGADDLVILDGKPAQYSAVDLTKASQLNSGWLKVEQPGKTITHELGHLLIQTDQALEVFSSHRNGEPAYTKTGTKNDKECIAESLMAYKHGLTNPEVMADFKTNCPRQYEFARFALGEGDESANQALTRLYQQTTQNTADTQGNEIKSAEPFSQVANADPSTLQALDSFEEYEPTIANVANGNSVQSQTSSQGNAAFGNPFNPTATDNLPNLDEI